MSTQPPIAYGHISVAIVDDDASVRIGLKRLCEVFGLTANAYASGRTFLASLEGGAPWADCLLLDLHMPEMTGSELQRQLAVRGIQIPTVVITADDNASERMRHATELVVCLQKPVSGEDLLAAIAQAVYGGRRPAS